MVKSFSVPENYMKNLDDKHIDYGASYNTFDTTVDFFNLGKLADVSNSPEPYIAYILMSRPSFNIMSAEQTKVDVESYQNYRNLQSSPLTATYVNTKQGRSLLMSLSDYSQNVWLPVVTNKAASYTTNDIELKTYEKGNTYYGHMMKYARFSDEHKVATTMSIEFKNDRFMSILKLMYLWMSCIYLETRNGLLVPKLIYQQNAIIDYMGSMYYLVTRRDGSELVYWEKITGVMPIRAPFSMFSFSDQMIFNERFNIDFHCGIRSDPNDPSVLMDINFLSGDVYKDILRKSSVKDEPANNVINNKLTDEVRLTEGRKVPYFTSDLFAAHPYIVMQKTGSDVKYYLRWERGKAPWRGSKLVANKSTYAKTVLPLSNRTDRPPINAAPSIDDMASSILGGGGRSSGGGSGR